MECDGEPHPDWLDPTLYEFTSRYATIAGNRVHYLDEGTGPVLLMLHGNPTWSFLYRHQIRALRAGFRCVAVDYPGFGLSSAVAGYRFRPADHAAVIGALVGRLGLEHVTLVAGDWGGPIGLSVAADTPDRFAGLVLTNTWAWPTTGRRRLLAWAAGGGVGRFLASRANLFAQLAIPASHRQTRLTRAETTHYLAPFRDPQRRLPTALFAHHLTASRDFLTRLDTGLSTLRHLPALIVWGARDPAFGAGDRRRLEHMFLRHTSLLLPSAGHLVPDGAPAEFTAAIRVWYAEARLP